MEKKRYHLLDMLRGVCIILVIAYHTLYNLSEVYGGAYAFFRSRGMDIFRDCFVGVLILISGISCSLSRSNLKRGIKTLLCAMLITAITAIITPDLLITFGILHFFGVCMLIYALCHKIFDKIPTVLGVVISVAGYLLTADLYFSLSNLPKSFLLYAIGFNTGFHSSDYYPLLPWIFIFLVGCFLGKFFKEGRAPAFFSANPIPPLSFIGRHTLTIYLAHQPIIFGGMWLWFECIAK